MNKPEFLEAFKRTEGTFSIYGSKILVERLDQGEVKTQGGIILAENNFNRAEMKMQRPHIAVVLAVGKGYYNADTNTYEPLEVKPGNIIMLNALGVQYYLTVPGLNSYSSNKIGLTTETDIQLIFEDLEAFEKYEQALNG